MRKVSIKYWPIWTNIGWDIGIWSILHAPYTNISSPISHPRSTPNALLLCIDITLTMHWLSNAFFGRDIHQILIQMANIWWDADNITYFYTYNITNIYSIKMITLSLLWTHLAQIIHCEVSTMYKMLINKWPNWVNILWHINNDMMNEFIIVIINISLHRMRPFNLKERRFTLK